MIAGIQTISRALSILIAGILSASCTTSVSHRDIQICRLSCDSKGGLHRIVIDYFKGSGCHCRSGHLLWLHLGEEGVFEDYEDLGDQYQELQDDD